MTKRKKDKQPKPPFILVLPLFRMWNDPEGEVPGAIIITATCGHRCWISPQGTAHLASTGGAITACLTCRPITRTTPVNEVPGTVDAVRALMGERYTPEQFDRIMAKYNWQNR